MFTEALEGEETEPRGGHGLPTGPGKQCGAVGLEGSQGAWGLGSAWGERLEAVLRFSGKRGHRQLRGSLSPG